MIQSLLFHLSKMGRKMINKEKIKVTLMMFLISTCIFVAAIEVLP